MATQADGGGGTSGPLDGSSYDTNADWYLPGDSLGDTGQLSGGPDGEGFWSAAWSGGGDVRGKIEGAMKTAEPDGLDTKGQAWTSASTDIDGYLTKLSTVWSKVGSAWSGDDADQAHQIFNGLYKTLSDQYKHTSDIGSALTNMHTNLKSMKDTWGHDAGTWDSFGNWATGDEDRQAADDYHNMMKTFKEDLGIMPKTVPTQVKPAATTSTPNIDNPGSHQGAGGAPSVGGAGGAPHSGNATPAHIQQPGFHEQNTNGHHPPHIITDPPPPPPRTDPPTPPTWTDPPTGTPVGGVDSPYNGGGSGIGLPGGSGAGLNTDGSLAGFDGSGGGAGVGGLGAGSGAGASLGAGGGAGLSGLGAGAGTGAGGAGTGGGVGAGGGAGGGSGVAGGASGAGGRAGMMPMHGGGQNDEDERERSTWLSEDDDVWGADDDVPTVIS